MKSIKQKHKKMQFKRYFFFMCRKSVAIALYTSSVSVVSFEAAGAPAHGMADRKSVAVHRAIATLFLHMKKK